MVKAILLFTVMLFSSSCSMFITQEESLEEASDARSKYLSTKGLLREAELYVSILERGINKPIEQAPARCPYCASVENDGTPHDLAKLAAKRRPSAEEVRKAKEKVARLLEITRQLEKDYKNALEQCISKFSSRDEGSKQCGS